MERIDFHTHLFYDRPFMIPLLDEWQMKVGIVNITGKKIFDDSMDRRWLAMLAQRDRHPGRFFLCTSFDAESIERADFADRVVADLQRDIDLGAVMVKVWKDIGLDLRDRSGAYLMIDDDRFRPVWDFLAERGIPVLAHIAEPRAAWLPLDKKSPHYAYYSTHPQYHLYHHPEEPSWDALIDARDRWVERNPGLTIIGAHLGSMEHDVQAVAERLDRFPNFYVDTAERFGDLLIQPREAVRSFLLKYADRILYGTDVIWDKPAAVLTSTEMKEEEASYRALLETHWNYLAGSDTISIADKLLVPLHVEGLNLPQHTLEAVYAGNARRLLHL